MNTLMKIAVKDKTKSKYLRRAVVGSVAGGLIGEAKNRYSGEKDPEKRRSSVGKGALVGAVGAGVLGSKGTGKAIKGTLKANKKVTKPFNTARRWLTM